MHIINVADIEIEVERKSIKNLHLAVYPPDARVHISMPDYLADDDARNFVLQKLEWLRTQIEEVLAQPRQTKRQLELKGNKLYMFLKPGTSIETRAELMRTWYRYHLKKELESMLQCWANKLKENPFKWQVKQMKTEWGSCIPSKRLLIFNLELARVPRECIEFVIVHEFCHFKVDTHNKIFEMLMNKRLPNWRTLRQKLNTFVALPYKE